MLFHLHGMPVGTLTRSGDNTKIGMPNNRREFNLLLRGSEGKTAPASESVIGARPASKSSPRVALTKLHETARAASPRVALGAISNRA